MQYLKLVFLSFLFSFPPCFADVFNIDLMYFYQTQTLYRGAKIWPKGTMLAAPGFLFFERKLKIFGPSISYSLFNNKEAPLKLDFGTRYFNDDKPLFDLGHHSADYRNRRKKSIEAYSKIQYNFGFKNKFFVGFYLGKELTSYKGLYSELSAGVPILPFTSIVGKLSYAEKKTNQYIYGPESISGIGYGSLGINLVLPNVPWDGIIINQLHHTWILKKQNQNADYIRGDKKQLIFSTRFIWKVF